MSAMCFWPEKDNDSSYNRKWQLKSQARRLALEYYHGSARPRSKEVIHMKLQKRKLAHFQLFSSFMFLCDF